MPMAMKKKRKTRVSLNWLNFISLLTMNLHVLPHQSSFPSIFPFGLYLINFWKLRAWRKTLIIVPQFYEGLCNCATLHPDPTPADEEMFSENHEWITAETLAATADGNGMHENAQEDEEVEGNVAKWRRTS
jgi:hypothetical protein